jgi:hypothetical protein
VINWTPVTPLSDEPQDLAYWEPWQPKIGDRVRVRLSGECLVKGPAMSAETGKRYLCDGHPEWENGVTGVVSVCRSGRCDGFSRHKVVVEFAHPDGRPWMGHFAACELEKIS